MPKPANTSWTGGSSPGADRPSVDGDWAFAAPITEPEISFPFDSDSRAPVVDSFTYFPVPGFEAYVSAAPDPSQNNLRTDVFIIEQEFEMAADFFEPLPLDTPYDRGQYAPDYQGFLRLEEAILIGESIPRNQGNGVIRWTRTYCRIPQIGSGGVFSRNTYESDTFTFPGIAASSIWFPEFEGFNFLGVQKIPLGDGRPPTPAREVTVRVQKDYFLAIEGAFSPNLFDPTLPNFIFQKFTIYGEFIWQELESVFDAGAFGVEAFTDASGAAQPAPFSASTPPKFDLATGEQGYLTAVENGWEIVCRQSVIRPWRGNIYEKTTYYTIAQ